MTRLSAALAAALAIGLAIAPSPVAFAAPPDAFAAACMARGGREGACACQSKLARAGLDAGERKAALAGLREGSAALKREVEAMGPARAKAFGEKMHALGRRAQAEC
ncbi:MAG: hypothetical protein ACO27F_12295 [Beijerinckiaceae bacterium]